MYDAMKQKVTGLLDEIRAGGLYKDERLLAGPQGHAEPLVAKMLYGGDPWERVQRREAGRVLQANAVAPDRRGAIALIQPCVMEHAPVAQDQDLGTDRLHLGEDVAGENQATILLQGANQLSDIADSDRVQTLGRLVEYD